MRITEKNDDIRIGLWPVRFSIKSSSQFKGDATEILLAFALRGHLEDFDSRFCLNTLLAASIELNLFTASSEVTMETIQMFRLSVNLTIWQTMSLVRKLPTFLFLFQLFPT